MECLYPVAIETGARRLRRRKRPAVWPFWWDQWWGLEEENITFSELRVGHSFAYLGRGLLHCRVAPN